MKNTFGNNLTMTIFGESHGPCIGITLDGLPSGFPVDQQAILEDMKKRKAAGKISTQRHEDDIPQIVSGLFQGKTTGTPLTILISNQDQHSKDYESLKGRLRPGHADYTAYKRYNGYQDYRGGGHFSGRLTACMVAGGSICKQILAARGVKIGSHLEQCGTILDKPFSSDKEQCAQEIDQMNQKAFAVLDPYKEDAMKQEILLAQQEGDSIGGILETVILNYPAGIGDPVFEKLDASLAKAIMSIGAVKGVEIGDGFASAQLSGSQNNDPFYLPEPDTAPAKSSNHAGGILGGISDGSRIILRAAIKPTPSISREQSTITRDGKNTTIAIRGRHDPVIVPRAVVVVESMAALALADAMMCNMSARLSSLQDFYRN